MSRRVMIFAPHSNSRFCLSSPSLLSNHTRNKWRAIPSGALPVRLGIPGKIGGGGGGGSFVAASNGPVCWKPGFQVGLE
jgi:hypothetical protein